MKQPSNKSYSNEEIDREIEHLRGQLDMMENSMKLAQRRFYETQRHFRVHSAITSQQSVSSAHAIGEKRITKQRVYRCLKNIADKTHFTDLLKKTPVFRSEKVKLMIYRIANGLPLR